VDRLKSQDGEFTITGEHTDKTVAQALLRLVTDEKVAGTRLFRCMPTLF
jgi:hypothetical protein